MHNGPMPWAHGQRGPLAALVLAPIALVLTGIAVVTDVRAGRADLDIVGIHPRSCQSLASGGWPPIGITAQALGWSIGAFVVLTVSFAAAIRYARRSHTSAARITSALVLIVLPVVATAILVTATDLSSYHDQFNGRVAYCAKTGG